MRTPAPAAPILFAAALIVTGGCAGQRGAAPSLAHRAVEDQGFAEPARPAPAATPDAALDAGIARRSAGLDAAIRAFDTSVRGIEPRIARGAHAREGSEAWLDAQGAIGELGQARAAVDAAFAELESLAIARASALAPAYPALDAALAAGRAKLDAIAATEDRLRAKLT